MASDAAPFRTDSPSALPPGTRLGEFELRHLLGVGGFGIVYLAFDHALEREVAVKEYMPASLAGRTETMHVSIRSHSDAENFALGLKSFVNEAKLLARFDHPSLLKVHRFWEANGTAYMAMPVLRGRTIKDVRAEMGGPPEEAWLRGVLMPLLGAIERLHSEGVYHRDIAPDNIQIEPDGRPVLLDFGAARRVLSDKTQSLTAILKPAYAPIEQYGEAGSVKQGPWTDLYALGATLHYVLMGRPPPPATARTVDDERSALTVDALPGCSERFLRTIEWMLCPRPADRPQSVAELRQVLEGHSPLPLRAQAPAVAQPWERTTMFTPAQRPGRVDLDTDHDATEILRPRAPARTGVDVETSASPPPPPVPVPVPVPVPLDMSADMSAERPAPAAVPPRSPVPAVLGSVAVLAAAAFFFWPKADAPLPAPAPAPAPAASAVVVPTATVLAAPVAASAAAPVADATPAPAAAASAESAVPTVVVPPPVTSPLPTPAKTEKVEKVEKAVKPERKPQEAAVKPRPEPAPRPTEPATPGPSCGPRGDIKYLVCMDRECGGAEFASHPACQRWRSEGGKQ